MYILDGMLAHLEGHVLKKVGNTIVLVILGTGTSIDPESNGGSGGAGILASDAQAIVQLSHLRSGYV